jgi:hypothetical protein
MGLPDPGDFDWHGAFCRLLSTESLAAALHPEYNCGRRVHFVKPWKDKQKRSTQRGDFQCY